MKKNKINQVIGMKEIINSKHEMRKGYKAAKEEIGKK